jgi:hypothetical protein
MSFVYVNPNHPQNLFAGGGTHDLFVSNDGAATWQAFDTSQLQGFGINNVLIDPSNPNRLFVATEGGVFSHLLD